MKIKLRAAGTKSAGGPRTKIATRSDVARLAGVSPAAVTQVLNKLRNTRISPAVRQKILDAVSQLGYRPHPIAKALVAGRTSIIGILIFQLGTPFGRYSSGILNASWAILKENAHRMLIDCKGSDEDISSVFLGEGWSDGYIVVAPPLGLRGRDAIPGSPHACVCIGSRPEGGAVSYVDMDNFEAGRMAVAYLYKKGHRKIAHISGPIAILSSARDRFDGYVQGLKDHGLPFRKALVVSGTFGSLSGGVAMEELLRRGGAFTAVFSANDGMALHAIMAAKACGLSVPGDFSIMGINDALLADDEPSGSLTTIAEPLEKIGAEAANILLKHLSELPQARRPIVKLFPGKIIEGESVARRQG
jgi:DNA-binding LacI/PurR family transcriptional regulator